MSSDDAALDNAAKQLTEYKELLRKVLLAHKEADFYKAKLSEVRSICGKVAASGTGSNSIDRSEDCQFADEILSIIQEAYDIGSGEK